MSHNTKIFTLNRIINKIDEIELKKMLTADKIGNNNICNNIIKWNNNQIKFQITTINTQQHNNKNAYITIYNTKNKTTTASSILFIIKSKSLDKISIITIYIQHKYQPYVHI